MFEASSDVSESLRAKQIVIRDAKEYELDGGETISIAQIETVGKGLLERTDELTEALDDVRDRHDYPLAALMVTDILEQGHRAARSAAMSAPPSAPSTRAAERRRRSRLPGVMSRKKQVAPKLLDAF